MPVLRGGNALVVSLLLLAPLAGCPKSRSDDKGAQPAASSEIAAVDAAPPEPETPQPRTFAGTYSVEPAQYYISDAGPYAKVKQAEDEPDKHVGEGKLSLTIALDGKVTGEIESGPAGGAAIDGTLIGDNVHGNVRRKEANEDGLTGTMTATVKGDAVEGKLSLADGSAAIVRSGTLSLAKK